MLMVVVDGVPVHMIHRQQEDTSQSSHHHNFFSMLLADSYFVWCVLIM